jgi:hypothetical protein
LKQDATLVTELLAETQNQSRKLENALAEANPGLNMALFMKQNNRYSARQAPLIWINESAIKLFTWHSPTNTIMFLLAYTLLCLHPILLTILPQCIVLGLMVKFYHQRADQIMNNKPVPQPHKIGSPPKLSPSASELKVAFQSIQNTMGQVSDIYDAGYNFYRMIDWSNSELTQDVLIKTLISILVTLIVVSFIPINYIFLVGGVGAFIANTPIVKAISITIAPIALNYLKRLLEQPKIVQSLVLVGKNGKIIGKVETEQYLDELLSENLSPDATVTVDVSSATVTSTEKSMEDSDDTSVDKSIGQRFPTVDHSKISTSPHTIRKYGSVVTDIRKSQLKYIDMYGVSRNAILTRIGSSLVTYRMNDDSTVSLTENANGIQFHFISKNK